MENGSFSAGGEDKLEQEGKTEEYIVKKEIRRREKSQSADFHAGKYLFSSLYRLGDSVCQHIQLCSLIWQQGGG